VISLLGIQFFKGQITRRLNLLPVATEIITIGDGQIYKKNIKKRKLQWIDEKKMFS